MPRVYKVITWQEAEEKYDVDFETLYFRRLGGDTYQSLANGMSILLLKRLLRDWCEATGHDFDLTIRRYDMPIITDPKLADKGKIFALRKARWSIEDIAYDCRCEESVVREILNGTAE